jgi:serine/threonine protein phosphatase 1
MVALADFWRGITGGKPSYDGSCVPAGDRVYAIGDIHGRLDLLRSLHEQIRADWLTRPGARGTIVYLGDYVDRGSDSRGVVDDLLEAPPCGMTPVYLRGNHEQMLLDFLDGGPSGMWLSNGGEATLSSYGLSRPAIAGGELLRDQFRHLLPRHHLEFLRALIPMYCIGDYCFVHAGVRPGVPLELQDINELIWIRGLFLDSDTDFGKIVVHGHSITPQVEWRTNRIGIDTGAYLSGRLTCLVLDGADRRILQT